MAIRRKEQTSKSSVASLIQQLGIEDKVYLAQAKELWLSMMGENVNEYTQKITAKGNTLTIFLESSPLRHELSKTKETILKKLQEKMESNYYKDIKFF